MYKKLYLINYTHAHTYHLHLATPKVNQVAFFAKLKLKQKF